MPRRARNPRRTARGRRAYHLGVAPGELPDRVLIPGDPARSEAIARSWESHEALADHREFRSFRGRFHGVELGVVSSGIGGPAMAIVVEELAALGCRTLIRVGSCGAIDPTLRGGEVAITTAAARFEATTRAYAPPGYPAVADPAVLRALVDAAESLGVSYRAGITATVDTFHASQGRRGFRAPVPSEGVPTVADLEALGILNIEMEASTLLTLSNLFRLRAGAVCAVYPDGASGDPVPKGQERAIAVANEAARRLA